MIFQGAAGAAEIVVRTEGRTCHVDVAAHDVQGRPACVLTCFMAASMACSKARGPATGFLAWTLLKWTLMSRTGASQKS